MSIFIPSKESKKYSVGNRSDLFGNLIRTRNLDFNKKGYVALARKPIALMTETIDANFESPLCIVADDSNVYVFTSNDCFSISLTTSDYSVTNENGGSPPTFGFQTDAVFFNGLLVASGTSNVCSFTGGTWTSRITGLTTSQPHPLCVSEHQQYLAVGVGAGVALYNTSWALQTTCVIPTGHLVEWIRWRGNLLYFGTRNTQGGDAKMFIWNGSGTAAQGGYEAFGTDWIFSGCVYGSTIAVVTSNGQLLQFAGDGFSPLRTDDGQEMNFPLYYTQVPWGSSAAVSNLQGKVTSRGMQAKGRRIYMVISDEFEFNSGGTEQSLIDMPGGLWVADPEVGLYHKAGLDHKQRRKMTISSVASDVLTIPTATVYETGDPVEIVQIAGLTGDVTTDIYYAIKVTSTTLKLARTPQEAIAGSQITITGTPSANDEIVFNMYESCGGTRLARAGGVCVPAALGMPRWSGIEVIFSGDVPTSTATDIGTVCSLGMGKNVGSFITPKIQASNVTDMWKKLIAKFPPLNIPTRKIIIKYRIANRWGMPGRGDWANGKATWVTSTTFTINPKTYDFYSAAIGDEIEFTEGAASGYTAHITLITVNSATQWTITIDEAMPEVVASDVSRFIVDNWTKYKTISTTDTVKEAAKGFQNNTFSKNSKWVQFKIELRGYTDISETMDFEELMLVNGADQKYA